MNYVIMLYFSETFIFSFLSVLGQYDEIIVYTVLGLSLLGIVLLFIHRWKESSEIDRAKKNAHKNMYIKKKNKFKNNSSVSNQNNLSVDLKLQAYERLTIFLSRIDPWRLLSLVKITEKNIKIIENSLLQIIISEFEYNLSQQVYVSDDLWSLIETSKVLS